MQVLENNELRVEIIDCGAELSRIYDKVNDCEIIHNADPKWWPRHAPILFPFVGASYNNEYMYNGTVYKMGQHGFARDTDFTFVSNDGQSVVYELTDSEETRANYPFRFKLLVTQRLEGRTVHVSWKVVNNDNKEMLFSIGAHPAFTLGEGKTFADVELDLHTDKPVTYYRIEDPGCGCCFDDQPYHLETVGGITKLNAEYFDKGVYIYQDDMIDTVTLKIDGVDKVTVKAPGFPFYGIWSKKNAPFICLEPWFGRAAAYGFVGELKDKKGVVSLGVAEKFYADYDIIIH
ncbi:MAG: aldose 1-epimerase family protein [Lachnospiraceae bacterium]|nr:aldose 1-epimerase family protein [Lachnospiraceae bacterium]